MKIFDRINPLTGAIASSAPAMTADQASEVASKAQAAFPDWAASGPNTRRAMS
jgi:acyl-CoA reductase-like NAD-dependent aldehyde dehydrogenase